ncbi:MULTISPECIES: signal peptidase I [Gammaproteobacteria]|uniref:signal peptidase I n=1 Tax=Gammaproteobacteria TaxID=1236 RepID=UPI000DCFD273|nr:MULTISPECIES: signal peptidase I [Gammaproteobacteria]RTE87108.1 signal peptidase I [Aliidiomarina sp. B3213]TCZ93104.1 signal peptidase I [Lysobacter sp. N42]
MTTFYFSLILVLVTALTGLVWLFDHYFLKPKRQQAVANVEEQTGHKLSEDDARAVAPEPGIVEFSRSAFPIIAFILIMRSFVYEPFRIPSGSMMPTLLVGDFILVEKFRYGVREPLTRHEIFSTGLPEHGDVAVFKYPLEPDIDYIKRIIGLPGDKIVYRDKKFYVEKACAPECLGENQVEIEQNFVAEGEYFQGRVPLRTFNESHGDADYNVLLNPAAGSQLGGFYNQPGTRRGEWIVPEGHYFAIGDNRDNSRDSRFWGFVPQENLVGRAVFVWLSLEFDHAPDSKLPGWVPTGIRFERLGRID